MSSAESNFPDRINASSNNLKVSDPTTTPSFFIEFSKSGTSSRYPERHEVENI
jgi:hypothetical protein